MHDEHTTWKEVQNNSKSSLPHYEYKGGEWIWLDGSWRKAQAGGFRTHALLEHEAALLGLCPPKEKLKVECFVEWHSNATGQVYPTALEPVEGFRATLLGKRGKMIFTEV